MIEVETAAVLRESLVLPHRRHANDLWTRTIVQSLQRPFAAAVIAAAGLLSGCASSPLEPVKPPPTSVPALLVSIDCNDCLVKSTVPELIRSSYAAAAAKAGVSIDDRTQFTLTIKAYSERGWGMRSVSLVAGPLAFMLKDEIKAVAMVSNREVNIEYAYRVPFAGIKSVAQRVGERSFEQVMK